MDEFKDYEDDKINFPGRPLPSGRVFKNDLKILIFAIYSMLIFFNAAFPLMMLGTLMIFGYSFFMYKWFFIEKKMRKNLPLAFISHHPIILFYYLYIVLSWMTQHQLTLEFFPLDTVFIFLPLLLVFTCWELSRKIKKPSEENQYTTYSKIFGMKESIVLCLLCLIGAFLAPFVFLIKMNLPLYIIMAMICVFLLNLFPFVQFLDSKNKNIILKKETEKMVFILFLPIILVSWLYHFYPSLSWWL
jgi:4-hydroxybenzoate polyprenyltransferase